MSRGFGPQHTCPSIQSHFTDYAEPPVCSDLLEVGLDPFDERLKRDWIRVERQQRLERFLLSFPPGGIGLRRTRRREENGGVVFGFGDAGVEGVAVREPRVVACCQPYAAA